MIIIDPKIEEDFIDKANMLRAQTDILVSSNPDAGFKHKLGQDLLAIVQSKPEIYIPIIMRFMKSVGDLHTWFRIIAEVIGEWPYMYSHEIGDTEIVASKFMSLLARKHYSSSYYYVCEPLKEIPRTGITAPEEAIGYMLTRKHSEALGRWVWVMDFYDAKQLHVGTIALGVGKDAKDIA